MSTDAGLRVDVREEAGRLTVAVMTGSLDLRTAPSLHRRPYRSSTGGRP